MLLGRSCPDMDAQLMFEPDEWKAAYILNKQKLPDKPPTLNEVVSREPRRSGWACSASLTSSLASGSHASFRLRGLVYNEMP